MKYKLILEIFVLCCYGQILHAQGAFQNLDFEAANVSGYTPGSQNVPVGLALPGWNVGGPTVWYDGISTGGALVSIVDSQVNPPPLQGQYSVYLFAGTGAPATISQTGLVPVGTRSVEMEINAPIFQSALAPIAAFTVSLGGQMLTMTPLQTTPMYTLYGADIPASFAGQSETLSITQTPPIRFPPSGMELDDIMFSTNAVPEPSAWAPLVCGTSAFALKRRRTKNETARV